MKKIFGISLIAVLAVSPIMAHAEPVAGEPTANAEGPSATSAPKYATRGAGDHDANAASAGYVKGAYNALIKGINKTQDEIDDLNADIDTYSDAIDQLTVGKATKTGTVATIKSATTTEEITSSSVNITDVTTDSISATASGNVNLTMPIMDNWESNDPAANSVETTTVFENLTVNGLAMSAPSANTATLTKNNIAGTVNVAEYIASAAAAQPYDYTPLISTGASTYGYKSADGSDSDNADGLANGEWKVTWNSYGTAKGTSMCSSDGGNWEYNTGTAISGTPASSTDPEAPAGCWCKLTGFTDNNNTTYDDTSLWVFSYTRGSASACAGSCAELCGQYLRVDSDMRSGMFNSIQQ